MSDVAYHLYSSYSTTILNEVANDALGEPVSPLEVCRESGNLNFLIVDAILKPMPLDEKAFGAVGDAMTRRKQEGGLHCHLEMGGVITGFPPPTVL